MLRPSPNHGTQRLPNDDDEPASSSNFQVALMVLMNKWANFVDLSFIISHLQSEQLKHTCNIAMCLGWYGLPYWCSLRVIA